MHTIKAVKCAYISKDKLVYDKSLTILTVCEGDFHKKICLG